MSEEKEKARKKENNEGNKEGAGWTEERFTQLMERLEKFLSGEEGKESKNPVQVPVPPEVKETKQEQEEKPGLMRKLLDYLL